MSPGRPGLFDDVEDETAQPCGHCLLTHTAEVLRRSGGLCPMKAEPSAMTAHQQARKDRAEGKATGLQAAGEREWENAGQHTAGIPMGQPILVGHHSERRHRRTLDRSHRAHRKAADTLEAAKEARWSAAGAGRAISSDDPDAIEALQAKLDRVEAERGNMKARNAEARKAKQPKPFESYELTNRSAEARRLKRRIAGLHANAARVAAPDIVGDGFTIEESVEDNRLRFRFDTKPDREACRYMKRQGFRFSRTDGAWQRQLNNRAVWIAKDCARHLFGWEDR